jgi:hypothetical protein
MAKLKSIVEEVIVCKCGNTEHQIIFTYFKDEPDVYMSIHLIPESNIFKRIWNGIKYIFGYKCKYGHFDEVIISTKDIPKLIKIISHLYVFDSKYKLKNS